MKRIVDDNFIILRRKPFKCSDREILLKITTKRELTDCLVRGEIEYIKVDTDKYIRFISEVKDNPFIRGHIKHINIFNLYSRL